MSAAGGGRVLRRELLGAAALAALATWVRPAAALARLQATPPRARRARNVVLLWMDGGPSQLDTFDPKPGSRFAGSFRSIGTNVDGVELSEHLPRLARRAQHLAIVRSMTTPTADHVRARELGLTGHLPSPTVTHPWYLCSAAAETADLDSMAPPTVTIGPPLAGAGYLDERVDPFVVADPSHAARALTPPPAVSAARHAARDELLDGMDRDFAARSDAERIARLRRVGERARALSRSGLAAAFDVDREPRERAEPYGSGFLGRSCLLARRLLEHGVRFVGIRSSGWDTHEDNFDVNQQLLADLDPAFAALLDDLERTGLLDETLVIWSGEFGRTPEINMNLGRDHHWRCFSTVLAGGGVRGGQVIGASSEAGHEVAARPVTVPDLLASVFFALGLDPQRTFKTADGRPILRLDSGEPVRELFA